ncbi:thiol-disulfide oxidoreductase DCC family protein [Tabrizicola sp.]|uniref:thiol-disulfide oxidoreductase DCC family protein n=1 Tax=Tabrizicola sp. TaxID=2005166 RepID=UPI003D2D9B06
MRPRDSDIRADCNPFGRLEAGFAPCLPYLIAMEPQHATAVLFNASCPVCNAEIQHYAAHAQTHALPIRFDDLNSAACADWGITPDMAARRLYVRHDGKVSSGVEGFLVLWSQMPRYRWLARLVGAPGLRQIATLIYDRALAPMLYRSHLRRLSKAGRG